MNEGLGITVNDISNNNYHGSTSGASWDLDILSQNCQLFNTNGCDSVAVLDLRYQILQLLVLVLFFVIHI